MDTIATLVRSIFQKESLHDCSVEELQTLARQYPYFSPAQFLLAEKLKSVDENLYKEQLQRLSLYINNPLWLDYLLNGYKPNVTFESHPLHDLSVREEEQVNVEKLNEESFSKTEVELPEAISSENNEILQRDAVEEIIADEDNPENKEMLTREKTSETEISESLKEEIIEQMNSDLVEETIDGEQSQLIDSENEETFRESETEISESVKGEIIEHMNSDLMEETIGNEQSQLIHSENEETFRESETEISESLKEEIIEQPNSDLVEETTGNEQSGLIQSENEETFGEEGMGESVKEKMNKTTDEPSEIFDEVVTVDDKQEHIETLTQEEFEGGTQLSREPVETTTQSETSIPGLPDLKNESKETELTFEPYHTVDYFASQGIKFVPEEKPVDRFGQQLKSFTEWLKAMKRLPHPEIAKMADPSSEQKVQQLADHSISDEEVVTETMAEVWLKQGNKDKAIEIYNKLSLLNPGKSAYFASLVEQLKNS